MRFVDKAGISFVMNYRSNGISFTLRPCSVFYPYPRYYLTWKSSGLRAAAIVMKLNKAPTKPKNNRKRKHLKKEAEKQQLTNIRILFALKFPPGNRQKGVLSILLHAGLLFVPVL